MLFVRFNSNIHKTFIFIFSFILHVLSYSEEGLCLKMEPYYILETDLPQGVTCPDIEKNMITKKQSGEMAGKIMYKLTGPLANQCNIGVSTTLSDSSVKSGQSYCPRTYDGFACWEDTLPGITIYQNCPSYVTGFDGLRLAHKTCTNFGTWLTDPKTGKPWSNYENCKDIEDREFSDIVKTIYNAGYTVSIMALVIATFIYTYFDRLVTTRVRIHRQLFIAMTASYSCSIIWNNIVINNDNVLQENNPWCQILHAATQYFTISTFLWILCTSMHLQCALYVVYVEEHTIMEIFMILGWGTPMGFYLMYALVRAYISKQTSRCWTDSSNSYWIISAPIILALAGAILFLMNVVRASFRRIEPANRFRSTIAKKAFATAVILVALFGFNYILLPVPTLPRTFEEKAFVILAATLTSLQGLGVSIIFCFANRDVINAVKGELDRWRRQRENIMALTSQGTLGDRPRGRQVLDTAV